MKMTVAETLCLWNGYLSGLVDGSSRSSDLERSFRCWQERFRWYRRMRNEIAQRRQMVKCRLNRAESENVFYRQVRKADPQTGGPATGLSSSVPLRKSYIVASTDRSGSTFFCSLLWQTGVLGAPAEYWNFRSRPGAKPIGTADDGASQRFVTGATISRNYSHAGLPRMASLASRPIRSTLRR